MKGEENKRSLLTYTYYDEYSTHISDIKELIERINCETFKERIESLFVSMMTRRYEPGGFDRINDDFAAWRYVFSMGGAYVPVGREVLGGIIRCNGLHSKKHYETMKGFIKEDLSRTVDLRTLINIPLKEKRIS